MNLLTDRERRDLEQELAILTGKQTVRKKSKKDIKDENDLLAKQAVAWKQIEDRLKIDVLRTRSAIHPPCSSAHSPHRSGVNNDHSDSGINAQQCSFTSQVWSE